MLALLSPSKTLALDSPLPKKGCTLPEHLDRAEPLNGLLRRMKPAKLGELMNISDNLAAQVNDYNQQWQTPFTEKNARAALLTFQGDVYEGLAAEAFKVRDLQFAQKHLRILSGLYGLLRPLDLMQPYRLEMGCKLARQTGPAKHRFKHLYQYWGSTIRESVAQALADQDDDVLINLASNEYFKAVESKKLDAQIITPVFKEAKAGKYKVISFFAKKARGQMVRFVLLNRLKKPADLQAFDDDGYRYNKSLSNETELVFTRGKL